eukprot:1156289-Pelagomonas_calceolata.AAC.7
MARLVEGMGSIDSPTHTQEDCVESDLCTLKLFAQYLCTLKFIVTAQHGVVAVRLLAGHQALHKNDSGLPEKLCFADEGTEKQTENSLAPQRNPGNKVQKARDTCGKNNKRVHQHN